MANNNLIHRFLPLGLLAVLLILSYKIVAFFISPVIWAAILAYVTWPVYKWLLKLLKNRANTASFFLTAMLTLAIGVPLVIGLFMLQQEAWSLYNLILHRIKSGYLNVPDFFKNIPGIGQYVKDTLWELNKDPDGTLEAIRNWVQSHLSYGKEIFDVLAKNFVRFGIAIMTLFFFYRDGDNVLSQVREASHQILGDRVDGYLQAVGATTQAVVYGIGLTALAQALLAGIGYYFAGAPSPILLTLMTLVIALIPFGTPFAWGGVVIYLFSQGQTGEAIGLTLWCMFVVGWVDNLIRPLVISGATKVPFMIILIGVLGGLSAFGFIGLFIGPVVLAIALAVWREWIARQVTEDSLRDGSQDEKSDIMQKDHAPQDVVLVTDDVQDLENDIENIPN